MDKMAEVPSRRNAPKRKVREVSEDSLPPAKKKQLDDDSNHESTSGRQHAHSHGGKRKPSHAAPKEHKYPSVNELKRRIRDVKRLLNRVDLPADARVVQERALAGYEKELQDELNRRQKSEMISRYHFVRFLERKTATKELKRLLRREKQLQDSNMPSPSREDELKHLSQRIHTAQINLNYTIYFPLTEKYISLYPNKKLRKSTTDGDDREEETQQQQKKDDTGASDSETQSNTNTNETHTTKETTTTNAKNTDEKPPMWYVIEKCTKKGQETLDLLRDGKLKLNLEGDNSTSNTTTITTSTVNKKKQQESHISEKKKRDARAESAAKQKSSSSKNTRNRAERRRDDAKHVHIGHGKQKDSDEESDGGFFEE